MAVGFLVMDAAAREDVMEATDAAFLGRRIGGSVSSGGGGLKCSSSDSEPDDIDFFSLGFGWEQRS